jgi:hypothetical protein
MKVNMVLDIVRSQVCGSSASAAVTMIVCGDEYGGDGRHDRWWIRKNDDKKDKLHLFA